MSKPVGKKSLGKLTLVIPDVQVKPGHNLDHLRWAGLFCAKKHHDRVIQIGDFYDFPSLCSYDRGRLAFEGRQYTKDIAAGNKALELFMEPIYEEQERLLNEEGITWKPSLDFCLGNHEQRINHTIQDNRSLDGLMGFADFKFKEHGWKVHPFLKVIERDGIYFSHYFTSGVMGRPIGSARALLTKKHASCVQGHVQIRDVAHSFTADGRQLTALFVSTYYRHNESYLSPQENASTWRGLWSLYNCKNGEFDPVAVPMSYLEEKFRDK